MVLLTLSCASLRDATEQEKQHKFIRELPKVSKTVAFQKSLSWLSNHFQSYKQVIDFHDSASGIIVARGILRNLSELSSLLYKEELGFTLSLEIKDEIAIFNFHSITGFNRLGEEVIAPDLAKIHFVAHNSFSTIADSLSNSISFIK
jgi:hypothetical protein